MLTIFIDVTTVQQGDIGSSGIRNDGDIGSSGIRNDGDIGSSTICDDGKSICRCEYFDCVFIDKTAAQHTTQEDIR